MSGVKELIRSSHIHIALITGVCIVLLAFVSKWILDEPIGDAENAAPSFIMMLYELLHKRYKGTRAGNPGYWMMAIIGLTILIVVVHLV